MYAKLAFRNLRRSLRDYGVYFVTLLFGVAVFYAFNSIGDQRVLFEIEALADADTFDMASYYLGMFSVAVACVLGFLVLYANRFLIRRRKQEFGTYLLLGMSPFGISRIVLYETFTVGVISLGLGLLLGIGLSQLLSFFTAALFGITMSQYQFLFSEGACGTTLLCFLVIFILVAILNLVSIGRTRLIKLINARQQNERPRLRKSWLAIIVCVISIGVLAWAYVLLIQNGTFDIGTWEFELSTILMLAGTLLLFWSGSSLLITLAQRIKRHYYRGLSMFTLRQVTSKINTAFASLWVICILLFFAITVFAVGMAFIDVFTGNIKETTLYDVTVRADIYPYDLRSSADPVAYLERTNSFKEQYPTTYAEYERYGGDLAAKFADSIPGWNDTVKESAEIDVWGAPGLTVGKMLTDAGVDKEKWGNYESNLDPLFVTMVSQSQYNAVAKLVDHPTVDIAPDEFAINNTFTIADEWTDDVVRNQASLNINGFELHAAPERFSMNTNTGALNAMTMELIVPDAVIESMREEGYLPLYSYLDLMLYNPEQDAALVMEAVGSPIAGLEGLDQDRSAALWPCSAALGALEMQAQSIGLRFLITYLALYIGLVFLLCTAAILAIQQLSETTDSLSRYRLLSKLGCDRPMIFGSLRTQVCLYFLAPLVIALCHASCALIVTGNDLYTALGTSILPAVALSVLLLVVIYGAYLLVTYYGSRSMVSATIRSF